ncbi:MAG: SDR family oxidoreductase [Anaerolineales bacterium]|uniref:SDR family oxidoreductase n=1 Tax=Promineifilum sp. TaxID=2664178 RepID=UPI001DF0B2D7|nr:SDR family oxidoreductase [Anaerolineales bacterium]MCB8935115.1 SDR family oxidoreductase [Promineifilum sp.]MCO5179154.1 SDR family oxidoreductase [Promineifilum sp.]
MTTFDGKNVLITGSASGIGRLMAQKLATRGANVILWDLNLAGLESLSDQLARWGYQATAYHQCDLSDREEIRETAQRVLAEQGPVDILINNAGIVSGKPLLELSDEAIERTFDVNALSLFWTTRAFLPAMVAKNQGHVVTISSAGGLIGVPKMTDYSASKFAAIGFDESLRVELKRLGVSGIRTTIVCPYYINTGMFKGVKTRVPWLLPIMEPEDVVNKIIHAIEKDKQRLIMPPFAQVIFPGRMLPLPWFDRLAEFFGINSSMDDFEGRGE